MAISANEYGERQAVFAAGLENAGLPGALTVSRGGSTFDRYADVLYLTGHYQSYSYLPDVPHLFSGRAHTVCVTKAGGRSILCLSVAEHDEGRVFADDVRSGSDFAAIVAGAVVDLGLDQGPLGLVGGDVLPYCMSQALAGRLPSVRLVVCDEILHAARRIKSEAERAIIRQAAAIHVKGFEAIKAKARPGSSEAELVAEFGRSVLGQGAGLYFTSMSSGPQIARWTSQSLPGFGTRRLEDGDLVRFDMGIVLDGYLSDFGRTLVVGEEKAVQRRLLDTVHHGIDAVLAAIEPGRPVRDVVAAGELALREACVAASEQGPGTIHSSFPVHWGHGLGLGWERPWMMADETLTISAGMYLAIERTLSEPGIGTAAGEQTLLVGESGNEILSEGPTGRWS